MFGDRLRMLREDVSLTQSDLAKKVKVSTSAIGMYEQNRRKPDFELLQSIADYFDVSIDYLLGKSDIPNPAKIIVKVERGEPFTDLDKLPQDAQDKIIEYYQMMVAKHLEKKQNDE